MKKYIVFAGSDFYPSGGMSDLCCSRPTIEECKKYLKHHPRDWWQIVDRDTWEIVEEG